MNCHCEEQVLYQSVLIEYKHTCHMQITLFAPLNSGWEELQADSGIEDIMANKTAVRGCEECGFICRSAAA